MKHIFVNLKRFEVARKFGGLCDVDIPEKWIQNVLEECINLGLGEISNTQISFLLPEALIIPAVNKLKEFPGEKTGMINIGCQGVHREDIKVGGNFGAFTTVFPATAAKTIGCEWAIIGHSEERKNIRDIMEHGLKSSGNYPSEATSEAVNKLINKEVLAALGAGLKVLYCIGETANERGDGTFAEQAGRIKAVLQKQLQLGLHGAINGLGSNVAIGYEPIWAIGPGKTPPDAAYIDFVSSFIKAEVKKLYDSEIAVVYGGGLKEENAGDIAQVKNIDGGLVALTRFTGQVGFYSEDLKKIIDKYLQ
ncbi:triosephosphate isomerase [Lucifera butyrica]|uniref:Triosephosphate isomerase n=1 Tax=Lucifera butyrica TaxID=1351585 RepID=A0A498R988_9FIRM|nr:triose-phosphate isomerase [Lucifera butyrica]VBB07739.1 triosephosphate isomerase [Lucifera butyrica]